MGFLLGPALCLQACHIQKVELRPHETPGLPEPGVLCFLWRPSFRLAYKAVKRAYKPAWRLTIEN